MIKQLLLFTFKDQTTSEINVFFEEYKKLETIDGVISIEFGPNISEEAFNEGYTYAAIVTFEDHESVSRYLEHPQHIKLAETFLNPILDKICIVDIEV